MLVFLSFLPPLTNFGLVTPMPNGIRVLGVEHLYELNGSREEGYKTKLIPPYCRIMFREENWLLICWLMMRLVVGSNKELVYMLMHI